MTSDRRSVGSESLRARIGARWVRVIGRVAVCGGISVVLIRMRKAMGCCLFDMLFS